MQTVLQVSAGKTERFALVLSPEEQEALRRLAEHERLSQAAVVRRLIWAAARPFMVDNCNDQDSEQ